MRLSSRGARRQEMDTHTRSSVIDCRRRSSAVRARLYSGRARQSSFPDVAGVVDRVLSLFVRIVQLFEGLLVFHDSSLRRSRPCQPEGRWWVSFPLERIGPFYKAASEHALRRPGIADIVREAILPKLSLTWHALYVEKVSVMGMALHSRAATGHGFAPL